MDSRLQLFKPKHIAFVWDSKKRARRLIYPEYKEQRGKVTGTTTMHMGEQDYEQMSQLRQVVLPMIGFKNVFMQIGYEADDIIASLVNNIEEETDHSVVIVTSDEDLYQVLSLGTSIYKLRSKELYTVDDFWMEYPGLAPCDWAMVKALAGCKTDDVEGLPGVGETTAYHYIMGNIKKTRGKDKIIESPLAEKLVDRNLRLVTLPFEGTDDYTMNYYEKRKKSGFLEMCNLYGFRSFEEKIEQWTTLLSLK